MAAYLLDTNVISCILKRQKDGERIAFKLQNVLRQNATILISPIVFYEIKRGLYHMKADRQLIFFEQIVSCFKWCDFNKTTWDTGAKLWANCREKGKPTDKEVGIDKDVLIAAQAKEHNAVVVTDNIRHFQYFEVNYESW
jgi:tRNA(fMet)-specific endonuclease VapC